MFLQKVSQAIDSLKRTGGAASTEVRLTTGSYNSNNMEYIVHGSKNQIDSSIFTYFGAI